VPTVRTTAVALFLVLSFLVGNSEAVAASSSVPFDSSDTRTGTVPDSLGKGTTTANADASSSSGAISVVAASTSDTAAGGLVAYGIFNVGIGGTQAYSEAMISQYLAPVTAGNQTFTANLTGLSVTTENAAQGINALNAGSSFSYAYVQIAAAAYFFPCSTSETCDQNSSGYTYSSDIRTVAQGGTTSGNLTLSNSFTASKTGKVLIQVYLYALTQTWGQAASGRASASATVSSVSVS
jgi:hypothetical protein